VATIPFGRAALAAGTPLGTLIPAALLTHLVVTALWGALFGVIVGTAHDVATPRSYILAGIIFGALVWMVDLYILAPAFRPWIASASTWAQLLAHSLAYGIPLGLSVWYATR
jgi:hypothetical protein